MVPQSYRSVKMDSVFWCLYVVILSFRYHKLLIVMLGPQQMANMMVMYKMSSDKPIMYSFFLEHYQVYVL